MTSSEDRGALFMRQEQFEDKVKALTQHLAAQGQILAEFGAALRSEPASIAFTNAPMGLGAVPFELLGKGAFEWSRLEAAVSLTSLAQTIQELRQAQDDLKQTQQALARR